MVGGLLTVGCSAFIALVLLVDIGAYNPYPTPPDEAMQKPGFGRSGTIHFKELYRRDNEPLDAYHERLTKSVNAWMVHWWPTENRMAVGVHPLDNYPMFLKSFFPGYEHFAAKEFVSPLMAWRRGFGFCSQVSRIVYSVLRDQGLDATIMQHPTHVVVEANGHVLDADYGVFIPHSLKEIQADPSLVGQYYGAKYLTSVPVLTSIYAQGWKETASKAQFSSALGFEASARRWEWTPMLMALWMAIAILDAGFCWPRFWKWTEPLRTLVGSKSTLSGRLAA